MTLIHLAKRAEKLAIDNSPSILIAIGITGTFSTAFLASKATLKASEIIAWEEMQQEKPLTNNEIVKLVWQLYIPAASSSLLTINSIVAANRISNKRADAIAAAYTITEKAYAEYKDKVIEKLGEKKEQILRDEIAQDRVSNQPSNQLMIIGPSEVLCYDMFTGRYFNSTMETLKSAQNDINYTILNDGYASLSDFYILIGLPITSASEEVGWTLDKLLELKFSSVLSETNEPCLSFDFSVAPVRNYHKFS